MDAAVIVGGRPRTHFDVTLDDGREVTMASVFIDYTYGGVMEGDPSFTPPNQWYAAAVGAALHHCFLQGRGGLGRGVVVVAPELRSTPPYPQNPHVPYVRVIAFVTSWHKAEGSALALVWFQDSFDEPLLERFAEAVHRVPNWRAVSIPWAD